MNRTRIFVSLLLLFVLSCVGIVWYGLRELPWNHKYAETPAPLIFNEVMGMPVPKGVTNIKVAPRHFFIKRWAKLRFNATPQALKTLLADAQPITSASEKKSVTKGSYWAINHRFVEEDLKKVGWAEINGISAPEFYQFYSHKSNFMWMGFIIIDRKAGTVLVSAGGD